MQCEKCNHRNNKYAIVCEKCGAPLAIEKDEELKQKYYKKQPAIEIEEVRIPENKDVIFDNIKNKIKKSLVILISLVCLLIFIFTFNIAKDIRSRNIMNQYNEIMTSTKMSVLYFGTDEKASDILDDYAKTYGFDYLFINTNKLTSFKRKRVKNDLKLNKLRSTVVIVMNGQVIDTIYDYKYDDRAEVDDFLRKNKVLPEEDGNSEDVIANFNDAIIASDPMVIYFVNHNNVQNENTSKELEKICNNYSINYTYIEGYYLTDNQKLSLLAKLNYNKLHDELLIVVDEGKVISVMEDVDFKKNNYFEIFSNYGIIDEASARKLNNITYDNVKKIISLPSKNVIIFGKNDCEYCERIKPILGKISFQYNLTIYYFTVNDNLLNEIDVYLKSVGYTGNSIAYPFVTVTENNHLLDYVVGLADKELFKSKFKELGVIDRR